MVKKSLKKIIVRILKTPMIVETGTSGIWTYRKWSNGVAECWGNATSANISNVVVSGWYGGTFAPPSFPTNLFVSAPLVFVNVTTWGTGYHFGSAYNISSTGCRIEGIRNDNASSAMTVAIKAKGRWK